MVASIFERIGGEIAMETAVEKFYVAMLADPMMAPFFAKVNMIHQKKQQIKFLTTALGGPSIYRGRDMWNAHKKIDLEQKHFDRVVFHLGNTLKSLGVSDSTIGMGSIGPIFRLF